MEDTRYNYELSNYKVSITILEVTIIIS